MRVGITGGIGAGKSLVSNIFEILGIHCFDADSRAKALMSTDPALRQEIINLFGSQSFLNEELNRKFISNQVFHNPEKLEKLNAIVHPAVAREFDQWSILQSKEEYILKEAALLFETGSYRHLDKNILVVAPVELRIKRILKRDPERGEDQIRAIMENQFDDEKKIDLADFVLYNNEEKLLIPQVLAIHQELVSTKKATK